jgi:hypothetical protein
LLSLARKWTATLLHCLLQLRQKGRIQNQQLCNIPRLLVSADSGEDLLLAEAELARDGYWVAFEEKVQLK